MTAHTERNLTSGQQWTRSLLRPRAEAFICVSNAAKDYLVDQGVNPDAIVLAPQTFAAEIYSHPLKKNEKAATTLLFVGYLSDRKGIQNLLAAMVLVHRENPGLRLSVVGNGLLLEELQQFVNNNDLQDCVRFEGFLEPHDLPSLYEQADIFVFPTLEDAFGVVVLEAIACGLPVICSKHAGVASHLVHNRTALIYDPAYPRMLADSILRLAGDSSLQMSLAAEAQKIIDVFRPEQVATQFRKAVDLVIDT